MKLSWWKILAVLLLVYVVAAGFMGPVPRLPIVNESIRNTYFHVPMWFGMVGLLAGSVYHAVQYLRTGDLSHDRDAGGMILVAILFGILGLATGMIWANYTWGSPWSSDPKQIASAVGLMLYLAYLVLRHSFHARREQARVSSVYSIFAFAVFIPLIGILPRFTDSLHPGNGGNPAFGQYDMDNNMRLVFYPAVLAWTLTGFWMAQLWNRYEKIREEASAEASGTAVS